MILCIISVCIGIGIGTALFRKPVKIELKISSFDSFMYAFTMFFYNDGDGTGTFD